MHSPLRGLSGVDLRVVAAAFESAPFRDEGQAIDWAALQLRKLKEREPSLYEAMLETMGSDSKAMARLLLDWVYSPSRLSAVSI